MDEKTAKNLMGNFCRTLYEHIQFNFMYINVAGSCLNLNISLISFDTKLQMPKIVTENLRKEKKIRIGYFCAQTCIYIVIYSEFYCSQKGNCTRL